MNCDHYWVSGDIYSDWICANCGDRADISTDMNAYGEAHRPHTAFVFRTRRLSVWCDK